MKLDDLCLLLSMKRVHPNSTVLDVSCSKSGVDFSHWQPSFSVDVLPYQPGGEATGGVDHINGTTVMLPKLTLVLLLSYQKGT